MLHHRPPLHVREIKSVSRARSERMTRQVEECRASAFGRRGVLARRAGRGGEGDRERGSAWLLSGTDL